MAQSRKMSLVEATANTVGGFVIALAFQIWLFGQLSVHASLLTSFWIAVGMMVQSFIRQFTFRRFFAWLERREERKNTKTWELIVENLPPLEWEDNAELEAFKSDEMLVRMGQR
jgi:fatty acid desaturase